VCVEGAGANATGVEEAVCALWRQDAWEDADELWSVVVVAAAAAEEDEGECAEERVVACGVDVLPPFDLAPLVPGVEFVVPNCTDTNSSSCSSPVRDEDFWSLDGVANGIVWRRGDVRMIGAFVESMGRMQVYDDADGAGGEGGNASSTALQWLDVCNASVNIGAVIVLCRQAGVYMYEGLVPNVALRPLEAGDAPVNVWRSSFACNGTEQSVSECSEAFWSDDLEVECAASLHDAAANASTATNTTNSTEPSSVLWVECMPRVHHTPPPSLTVLARIVGNDVTEDGEGQVEIFDAFASEWRCVCDEDWDDAAAVVLCRQLDYDDAESSVALRGTHFASCSSSFYSTSLSCTGL
jgi:hypothetical protein